MPKGSTKKWKNLLRKTGKVISWPIRKPVAAISLKAKKLAGRRILDLEMKLAKKGYKHEEDFERFTSFEHYFVDASGQYNIVYVTRIPKESEKPLVNSRHYFFDSNGDLLAQNITVGGKTTRYECVKPGSWKMKKVGKK